MHDNVICENCGRHILVKCGQETCPCCGSVGTFSWADEEQQEVEAGYDDLPSFGGENEPVFENADPRPHALKAVEIEWDSDEPDVDELPEEIDIPDGMTDLDEISDYLSDFAGCEHSGFRII